MAPTGKERADDQNRHQSEYDLVVFQGRTGGHSQGQNLVIGTKY